MLAISPMSYLQKYIPLGLRYRCEKWEQAQPTVGV